MANNHTASAAEANPIMPGAAYPLAALRSMGIGTAALRKMRRNGLRVLRVGRLSWVLGSDLIDYLATKAEVVR